MAKGAATSSSATKIKLKRSLGTNDSKHAYGQGPKIIMGQSTSRTGMHDSVAPSEWQGLGLNGKTSFMKN